MDRAQSWFIIIGCPLLRAASAGPADSSVSPGVRQRTSGSVETAARVHAGPADSQSTQATDLNPTASRIGSSHPA